MKVLAQRPIYRVDMPKLSAEDLAEYVEQIEQATPEELDELLTDLLVVVYPTKDTQDS